MPRAIYHVTVHTFHMMGKEDDEQLVAGCFPVDRPSCLLSH